MAREIERREPDPVEGTVHRPPDSREGWQLLTYPGSGKPFAWYRPDPDGPGMDAQVIFPQRQDWQYRAWQDAVLTARVAQPQKLCIITGI